MKISTKPKGKIPNQDLRGTKGEKKYAQAADRGFKSGPKAAFNELKKGRDMKAIPSGKGNDLRAIANKATSALPPAQQAALKAIQKGKIPTQDLRQVAKQALETAAKEILKKAAVTLMSNPIFWIVVAIIIAILFIIFIITTGGATQVLIQQNQNNPLQIIKSGPSQAKVGQTLNYQLNVTYPGSATQLVIVDPIPAGTTYVSSSPKGDFSQNQVTWDSKKIKMNLGNPINVTVSLTVKATKDNNNVYNSATATLTGGNVGSSGGNVPANNNTCGGKYNLNSPYKNFGDPQCNFTKQAMDSEINQLDSPHAYTWDCMAMHESGYDPDAYNPGSTSGNGAYGLLQMNPQGKGNGVYDNGTVNYPLQVSNAINYNNKVINQSFAYWATYGECH